MVVGNVLGVLVSVLVHSRPGRVRCTSSSPASLAPWNRSFQSFGHSARGARDPSMRRSSVPGQCLVHLAYSLYFFSLSLSFSFYLYWLIDLKKIIILFYFILFYFIFYLFLFIYLFFLCLRFCRHLHLSSSYPWVVYQSTLFYITVNTFNFICGEGLWLESFSPQPRLPHLLHEEEGSAGVGGAREGPAEVWHPFLVGNVWVFVQCTLGYQLTFILPGMIVDVSRKTYKWAAVLTGIKLRLY